MKDIKAIRYLLRIKNVLRKRREVMGLTSMIERVPDATKLLGNLSLVEILVTRTKLMRLRAATISIFTLK